MGLGLAAAAVVAVPSAYGHANHPAHLYNNTVNSAKIVNQSIQSIDIAAQAVGTSEIRDQSIQKIDIGANAVGTSEISDQSIGSIDIGANAVSDSELRNTDSFTMAGLDVNGVIRAIKDNATSFRLRGPSDTTGDGTADSTSESYAGVFYNAVFDDTGGTGAKTTRAIWGSNEDMDLEFQGSNHIRITAVDSNVGTGRIRLAAEDQIQFHVGGAAETDALVGTIASTGLTLASGKNLTVIGDVDFSGATSLQAPAHGSTLVDGADASGTCSASNKGDLRIDVANNFFGCDGTDWQQLNN
ncbi:MAG: hypothetical protein U1D32_03640 [Patescibacteria group bacterium]|nr:hypothetical protein [Patescibacteria group bacterium]